MGCADGTRSPACRPTFSRHRRPGGQPARCRALGNEGTPLFSAPQPASPYRHPSGQGTVLPPLLAPEPCPQLSFHSPNPPDTASPRGRGRGAGNCRGLTLSPKPTPNPHCPFSPLCTHATRKPDNPLKRRLPLLLGASPPGSEPEDLRGWTPRPAHQKPGPAPSHHEAPPPPGAPPPQLWHRAESQPWVCEKRKGMHGHSLRLILKCTLEQHRLPAARGQATAVSSQDHGRLGTPLSPPVWRASLL